jgi:exopolysaccharide production protein ExoY
VSYVSSGPDPSPQVVRPSKLSRAVLRPPLKRAIDTAVAVFLLLLVAPVFLLVLLLVRAEGGSAFVARRRVGRGGREFDLLAFRTTDPSTGQPDVPQVTRLGQVLHWTCLDLLPHLLNVLRGDMSLVGPQPVTRAELDRVHALFGGRAAYLSARPGLVGPCQVCGRTGLGAGERVALDTDYVQHPSLRTDLGILARSLGLTPRRSHASR